MRMFKKSLVIGAVIMAAYVAPTEARWYFQSTDSAFNDNTTSLMLEAKGKYGLGVRCKDADTIELMYATPDKSITSDLLEIAKLTNPALLLRVDKGPVHTFDAELTISDAGDLVLSAEISSNVVWTISGAKRDISIALRMLDDLFHENKFSSNGTTKAAKKLQKKCGFDGPSN